MTNKHCCYTNNPHIINRNFYNMYIKSHVINGGNVESSIDCIWAFNNHHRIAVTEGLFTHNRIDGHINCDCCRVKYGGISDICTWKCCPSTITGNIEYTM